MNKEDTPKADEATPFEKFKFLAKRIVNVPREEYKQEQTRYRVTKSKSTRRGKVKAVS